MKKNNDKSLKKIFDELDIKPKKHLGQNFLHDLNIIKAIVKVANVENENIIEIGPGPGNLTELMIKQKPKTIFAIEKDRSFRKRLEDIKINNIKLFKYKIDDVLNYDFTKLEKKNYKIVSNLPYNISVPFISYMIKFQNTIKWKDMTLMVQKEVADRILADTGTKNYGRLSLMVSLKNHITKINPLGDKFDYNLHQAMYEAPSKDYDPGSVIEVVQPGYLLHDRLVRPAMVGISKKVDSKDEKKDNVKNI